MTDITSMPPATPLCQCIQCGCDDHHACVDLLGDPCSWLVQSDSRRLGVCSECWIALRRWRARKRHFSNRATAAIAQRRLIRGARTALHVRKKTSAG